MTGRSTMKKSFALALAALLLAATGSLAALEIALGFEQPREKIELPYTNNKCLKNCHAEKTLHAGGKDGVKRDLFVDNDGFFLSTHGQKGLWCIDCHAGADPNFHPRAGLPKVDCRACHAAKPPENVYPPNAAEILAARNLVKPAAKLQKGDGWMGTPHGMAWLEGKENAPSCASCHTAHYIRKAKDPESTVHRDNLPETCGKCHRNQVDSVSAGGAIARWSIAGHGKGDFSELYSESQCLSCHQGSAAHGEDKVTNQACPSCHRPSEKIAAGSKGFHVVLDCSDGGFGFIARAAYDVVFWGGAAGLLILGLFFGITSLYRKDDSGGDA
jgi:nitrate reductase cytochrome c-type subunit